MNKRISTEIKVMNNEEIRDFCIKKDLKIFELEKENERLNNIINELEDWLEKQRIRNSEWDNFVVKDGRLGIPISYLFDKLQELKGSDK